MAITYSEQDSEATTILNTVWPTTRRTRMRYVWIIMGDKNDGKH